MSSPSFKFILLALIICFSKATDDHVCLNSVAGWTNDLEYTTLIDIHTSDDNVYITSQDTNGDLTISAWTHSGVKYWAITYEDKTSYPNYMCTLDNGNLIVLMID